MAAHDSAYRNWLWQEPRDSDKEEPKLMVIQVDLKEFMQGQEEKLRMY